MANDDKPFGLRPVGHLIGGTIRTKEYATLGTKEGTALANNIYIGDLVQLVTSSVTIPREIDAMDTDSPPAVGVFAGCFFFNETGKPTHSRHYPASQVTTANPATGLSGAICYVYDDPFIIYEIQGDGVADTQDIGQTANIAYTEGDTVTGQSKVELDVSAISATGQHLYIHDIAKRDLNDFTLANGIYLVTINEHQYRNVGGGSFDLLAAS